MSDIIQTMVEPHHEAEELLPWYVTGQLDLEEQALVEDHVSSCARCRRQLAFERRLIDEFAAMTPEVDSGWARLRRRIEPQQRASWWDQIARDAGAVWQTFTRPAVAALAAAQLAFVEIAGALLFSLSQLAYQALGSSPPPQSANVIAMFRADTTESQLADLLRSTGAVLGRRAHLERRRRAPLAAMGGYTQQIGFTRGGPADQGRAGGAQQIGQLRFGGIGAEHCDDVRRLWRRGRTERLVGRLAQ